MGNCSTVDQRSTPQRCTACLQSTKCTERLPGLWLCFDCQDEVFFTVLPTGLAQDFSWPSDRSLLEMAGLFAQKMTWIDQHARLAQMAHIYKRWQKHVDSENLEWIRAPSWYLQNASDYYLSQDEQLLDPPPGYAKDSESG